MSPSRFIAAISEPASSKSGNALLGILSPSRSSPDMGGGSTLGYYGFS